MYAFSGLVETKNKYNVKENFVTMTISLPKHNKNMKTIHMMGLIKE